LKKKKIRKRIQKRRTQNSFKFKTFLNEFKNNQKTLDNDISNIINDNIMELLID
jgi:guanylate kinase